MIDVRLGLHISNFTRPDGAQRLGPVLSEIASAADEAGFDRVSVMDHVWQIHVNGPPEHEMLEAYKPDVLKRHCDAVGRDDGEIEKTVLHRFTDDMAETAAARRFAGPGITVMHGGVRDAWGTAKLSLLIETVEGL